MTKEKYEQNGLPNFDNANEIDGATILNIDMAILFSNAQPENIIDVFNCDNRLCYHNESAKPQQDPWIKIHEETFEEACKQVLSIID